MSKNKFKVTNVWANTQSQRDTGLRIESMDYENQEIRYVVPDNMQITLLYIVGMNAALRLIDDRP